MDLISSANDFGMVFDIGDHLGKMNKTDHEGRRNTASVDLTSRVSENVSLSRASAADNIPSCASVAEGNLLAGT